MVTKKPFGVTKNGIDVFAYTIRCDRGIAVTVLDYGATLQSVVLDQNGEAVDILLGYDTIEEYEQNDSYLGASVGRFAGRIPDAVLRIGEHVFPVTANEGNNQLHGGKIGFDKRVWNAETGDHSVTFSLFSADGEEGFPGAMRCTASFVLENDVLTIAYSGESDAVTAWNPTNHGYWNLDGHGSGDTRSHRLEIPADRYVPVGSDMIPLAEEEDVSGTRFDFRSMRPIESAYDNSFVMNGNPIRLIGNRGIGLEITTDCAAVQLYNAKFLPKGRGKNQKRYGPFGAVCLETEGRQTLKNSPVAEENVLYPGKQKTHSTKIRFVF